MAKERSKGRQNIANKNHNSVNPRDWLPCQVLSMVYSRQIIEGIHESVLDMKALHLFVSVIYRNNTKIVQHFNIPSPNETATSLFAMVKAVTSGKLPKTKHFFSFCYAWLYLNQRKFKSHEETVDALTEAVDKAGVVYAGKRGNASDSLPDDLVKMYDRYHLQAIVSLFGQLLRIARPTLKVEKSTEVPVKPKAPVNESDEDSAEAPEQEVLDRPVEALNDSSKVAGEEVKAHEESAEPQVTDDSQDTEIQDLKKVSNQ